MLNSIGPLFLLGGLQVIGRTPIVCGHSCQVIENQQVVKKVHKSIPIRRIRTRNGCTFLTLALFLIAGPRARDLPIMVIVTRLVESWPVWRSSKRWSLAGSIGSSESSGDLCLLLLLCCGLLLVVCGRLLQALHYHSQRLHYRIRVASRYCWFAD